MQDVLKRVDLAFDGFFRRVKGSQKPDYSRFRSYSYYDSFSYSQSRLSFKGNRLHCETAGIAFDGANMKQIRQKSKQ